MIEETQVFEKHGVWACKTGHSGWVDASEAASNSVSVAVSGVSVVMSPDAALRLAAMLRRLAQRVKTRIALQEAEA